MKSSRLAIALPLAAFVGLAAIVPGVAHGKDVADAEHDRLADEMEQLAQRQVWSGVERKYLELEKLGIELNLKDHLNGAYAAREIGDVEAAYERLTRAAKIEGTKQIVDWLWDIDANYGHVDLIASTGRHAELTSDEMPFDPMQRKAVEYAMEKSRGDNQFSGRLPKGSYVFSGQPFTVVPGVSVRIEVSPKQRRQGLVDPVIIYRDELGNPTTVPPDGSVPQGEQ